MSLLMPTVVRALGLGLPCGLALAMTACTCQSGEPTSDSPAHDQAEERGRIRPDAPLPITNMLGAKPEVVESHLGEPLGKGTARDMCVRFVPERTWFRCRHVRQRYASKQAPFRAIGVEYEDQAAASMSWEGLSGSGPFDPGQALRQVGLELPGEPDVERPSEGVTVWNYPNSEARLMIHGRQYRVRVSTVNDDWARGKVELILNDPLNSDEQSRTLTPGQGS